MKTLSDYKKGIDYVVNIAKSFGDAFAYFFYQKDLELFNTTNFVLSPFDINLSIKT